MIILTSFEKIISSIDACKSVSYIRESLQLAYEGYTLILTGRDLARVLEIVVELQVETNNQNIHGYKLDVSNKESILELFAQLQHDGRKIDVLVNNAGIMDKGKVISARELFDTNYYGVINTYRILSPLLTEDAKILAITSKLGQLNNQPQVIQDLLNQNQNEEQLNTIIEAFIQAHEKDGSYSGFSANYAPIYQATKALLNAYNRYVLKDLVGPNQTAIVINPGWVKTDMGGQNAPGDAKDGIVSSHYLITQVPFGRVPEYHGKYVNDKYTVEQY